MFRNTNESHHPEITQLTFRSGSHKKQQGNLSSIEGDTDPSFKDSIYTYSVSNDENGCVEIARIEKISVYIRVGKPSKAIEDRPEPEGVYWGNCLPNPDNGNELTFNLDCPEAELVEVMRILSNENNARLAVQVELLCFTNEVDDAFREWWMPRDYLIPSKGTLAPLVRLVVKNEPPNFPNNESEQELGWMDVLHKILHRSKD